MARFNAAAGGVIVVALAPTVCPPSLPVEAAVLEPPVAADISFVHMPPVRSARRLSMSGQGKPVATGFDLCSGDPSIRNERACGWLAARRKARPSPTYLWPRSRPA